MTKFQYTGRLASGEQVVGILRANDRLSLEERLIDDGVQLESCSPAIGRIRQHWLAFASRKDLTKALRQVNLLTESDIGLVEAIELSTDTLHNSQLKSVFSTIVSRINQGQSIVSAFESCPYLFDEMALAMIRAGEQSGRMGEAFDRIASYREKREELTGKIRQALTYPMLVVLVAILVVAALVLYIVPVFSSMYANFGAELPQITKVVVSASTFIRDNLLVVLSILAFITLSSVVLLFSRRVAHWVHSLALILPLLRKIVSDVVAARFCRTLGALLLSDVILVQALEISRGSTGNMKAKALLAPVAEQVSLGGTMADSIANIKLFPRTVVRLIDSGERTGQLGRMLMHAADYYERETDDLMKSLTSLIEPVIIIFLGLLVAFILVAMYLPLFDLVGQI